MCFHLTYNTRTSVSCFFSPADVTVLTTCEPKTVWLLSLTSCTSQPLTLCLQHTAYLCLRPQLILPLCLGCCSPDIHQTAVSMVFLTESYLACSVLFEVPLPILYHFQSPHAASANNAYLLRATVVYLFMFPFIIFLSLHVTS